MKATLFLSISCFIATTFGFGQAEHTHTHSRSIKFPDIPGYKTLSCDFHIHTVFSDGSVWPDIRVQEALRDGLDAIALTEHIEYLPHIEDIPHPDRNRSFEIAKKEAASHDLLIIHGAEITRDLPPGHSNAIFITDANKLQDEDPMEVFREAKRQGAFVFWNHPNWISQQKNGIARLTDMHRKMIKEGLLHGIEVINDLTYSDEALQIALDEDLAVIATSDIHGLVDWQYEIPTGGHRPVMLVFAEEKSSSILKSALEAGRTLGYFKDLLVGREEYLKPLVQACIKVNSANYIGDSQVLRIELENVSNARIILKNKSPYSFHAHSDLLEIPASGKQILDVKTRDYLKEISIDFEVLNGIISPNTHPRITVKASLDS